MTATEQHLAALGRLYGQDAESLLRDLPNIGCGLEAQCRELSLRPSAAGAEILASNLDGARRHVLRIAERLRAEGEGHGR